MFCLRDLSLFCLGAVLATACERTPHSAPPVTTSAAPDSIFGGTSVTLKSPLFRSVVGVLATLKDGTTETCSGVIVSKRNVLTAAHCVDGDIQKLEVVFGASDLENLARDAKSFSVTKTKMASRYTARAKEIAIRELWHEANQFDYALLALAKPIPNSVPVQISAPRSHLKSINVLIAGFGFQGYDALSDQLDGTPRLAKLYLKMNRAQQTGVWLTDQTQGRGVCIGDSGAPVFLRSARGRLSLIGLVSSVRNPGNSDVCRGVGRIVELPATMTRLAFFQ